jgi:hypothetical protein
MSAPEPRPGGERAPVGLLGGDAFSWAAATVGWRGAVESSLPGIVFVVVWVIRQDLGWPLLAAAATAIALAVVRLIQRRPVMQALTGLVGVGICVVLALLTGRAENYMLPAILLNAGYLLACLISLAAGWPLVGLFVSLLRIDPTTLKLDTAWRADPFVRRRCAAGTWLLAAMFAARIAVKLPLYLAANVAWLGAAHIAMGFPLYALTLWGVWLLLRGHVHFRGTSGREASAEEPTPEDEPEPAVEPDSD